MDGDPTRKGRMPRIELVYFNAGGGHRAAARALGEALRQRHPGWDVQAVNLFGLIDPQQRFRRLVGVEPEDLYNVRLKTGWTIGLAQELKLLQASIRLGHSLLMKRLVPHWVTRAPDLVVSLIPHFNRPLIDSVNTALPSVPCLTVITDLADYPPHFWIEPARAAQHIVCGTARAVAQAQAMGVPASHIHRVSGMVLHPDFYGPALADPAREHASLGLDPQRRTGIVMFGGHGAPAMATIARELGDLQLILLCGHNEALAERLRRLRPRAPHAVLGFTPHVRRLMQLGDFFIGKPGPGSLSEALHLGLPVVTFFNTWTMPQERYNADWVRSQGLGVVIRTARSVRPAVEQLLARIESYQANVRRLHNVAVFEVVDVIESLLRAGGEAVRQCSPRELACGHVAGR